MEIMLEPLRMCANCLQERLDFSLRGYLSSRSTDLLRWTREDGAGNVQTVRAEKKYPLFANVFVSTGVFEMFE